MERLLTLDQLRNACTDPLVLWAAQGMGSGVEVWAHGSAIAAAVTDLARRHRLAVTGAIADIAVLVRALLDRLGPEYRPLGDADTIVGLCDLVPELTPSRPFGWMTATRAPGTDPGSARPAARNEQAAINQVLDESLPDSLARPGGPGVTRWWVGTDDLGVAACAAGAWSAPDVGLLAGVATSHRARGRGLGRAVTTAGLATLIREHGTAALMVDGANTAARALYESLGMIYRPIRAAAPAAA
ncbi:MAG: GNAT family N-acetyltransferase [Actinomycetota bacterium]|nr:GNAT family N-acetyltransferase [Actinomycetota bacterium]